MRFRQLLFLNEYPPSTLAGAPIIARQLLRHYDPERLDILCCDSWYRDIAPTARETLLPSRHTTIPSFKRPSLRPRRVFVPIEATLESLRIGKIVQTGKRLVKERGTEAIFTVMYNGEFPLAAYQLSQETGLPLYVFESDDWSSGFPCARVKRLILKNHAELLRHAKHLWLTSPAMVRTYQERYGVQGEFLFHYIDPAPYHAATEAVGVLPSDRIHLVYAGSINIMFQETMDLVCGMLNRGLNLGGRSVEMTIYSATEPRGLLGPGVRWGGLVRHEEIPRVLAEAHALLLPVSFSQDAEINRLVRTSLFTKTVDYLATRRPVLVIAPAYSAEVDYFAKVTAVVDRPDEEAIVHTLRRLIDDAPYREELTRAGWDLVRANHSKEALHRVFLRHFLK